MLAAKTFLAEPLAQGWTNKPATERWLQELGARPAVQRGMQVPKV
jgi:GST-like protein